ncbi:MAG TPA: alpha/beta fold hydrolase [Gemmatimonadaceae bacterium]|nr:alpha/beta fold hydrolase [Gemmatimonadaceae bacterium]
MPMIAIRDVSLFVKVMGHGYPILLMHGGPGLDYTTLDSLEPLADRFTLIFYDHRCNGRSTGAVETMTFDNLTADADALRQTLGFEQWAVAGHSFGGNVALEYALRYPESISHLLLLDTCADSYWYQESAPTILAKRGYKTKTVEAARRFYNGDLTPDEVYPIVRKFLRAYFFRLRLRDMPHAIAAALRMKMRHEAHVFGFGTTLKNWSVMDRLGEIEMPTLVLGGRMDFLFPPEHLAILADRIPNAQLEIIERAAHSPHAEQADEVMRIMTRFIAARTRPSAHPRIVASARSH